MSCYFNSLRLFRLLQHSCRTIPRVRRQLHRQLHQCRSTDCLPATIIKQPSWRLTLVPADSDRHGNSSSGGPSIVLGTVLAFLGLFKKEEKSEKENVRVLVRSGIHLQNQGDLKAADRAFHKALELAGAYHRDQKLSDDEHLNAQTMIFIYLANIALAQQNLQSAESLYKAGMQGCLQLGMAKTHNAMVEMSLKLTSIYAVTGRDLETREGFKFCIETQETKLAEMRKAQLVEAEAVEKREVEETRVDVAETEENTNVFLGMALNGYGRYLMSFKEFAKAEPLIVKSLAVAKEVYGPNHNQTLMLMNDLATVKLHRQDYKAAEDILKDAIIIGQKCNSEVIPVLYCNIGAAYIRQSQLGNAKTACEMAHSEATKRRNVFAAHNSKACLEKVKEIQDKQQNKE